MDSVELQPTKSRDPSVSCSSWMHLVPDTVPIRELAIPGTHNSACVSSNGFHIGWQWARCQTSHLEAQLHMGVRYFDLRLADSLEAGEIYVSHTLCSSVRLIDAVETLACFLETHPSEFVFLCIKKDWKHRAKWKETSDIALLELLQGLPLAPVQEAPVVGQLRGQCIVTAHELAVSVSLGWRDSLFARKDCWDLKSTTEAKLQMVQHLEASEGGSDQVRFLGCNVVVGVKWPQSVANEVNPWLSSTLKRVWSSGSVRTAPFGVIAVDFAEVSLVFNIIALNFWVSYPSELRVANFRAWHETASSPLGAGAAGESGQGQSAIEVEVDQEAELQQQLELELQRAIELSMSDDMASS